MFSMWLSNQQTEKFVNVSRLVGVANNGKLDLKGKKHENSYLGKTSVELNNVIWAEIDGLEYGINEDFDVASLQCDGTPCDCIYNESLAEYAAIAEEIQDAVEEIE